MTSTSDRVTDPIDQVRRAVEAYRQSRQARDDAIADAAIALGREAAAEASGLSLSRIQQLVSDRTRTTNATRRSA
ncbi:hypothetical protein DEJ13_17895 (plasmid) [Curtobacterium sp. MCLR17_007]|uniref:hypothetical protein n=1 Tax=Microbacteriaceae TaxID=85023 RepID=UPI000DAA592A|nr:MULTISPECIES: hypothetical protein [Microbacteriaceae]MWJ38233.1 hypothetical protein [Clavibacter michiganensis subsp. michiganensis]WIB62062.1 hypothetical protein DEJ13_17895 [Curtobacterium sp. MCLR17_007]